MSQVIVAASVEKATSSDGRRTLARERNFFELIDVSKQHKQTKFNR